MNKQVPLPINPSTSCIGIVLAGGLSSRMGQDKALLPRGEKSMLDHSKQLLTNSGCQHVVISGDQHGIADVIKQAGPIGGIYSVLASLKQQGKHYQSALILPVDLPLLTTEILAKLKQVGELSAKAVSYHQHALPLYLPLNAYSELFFSQAFDQFSGKGPSVQSLIKQVPHQSITLANTSAQQDALFNTNTYQQWQQANAALSNYRSTNG